MKTVKFFKCIFSKRGHLYSTVHFNIGNPSVAFRRTCQDCEYEYWWYDFHDNNYNFIFSRGMKGE